RERQQFRDGGLCLFNVSDAPMIVDLNVATDCPSQLFEALLQRYRTGQTLWVTLGKWHQHADTALTLALLRTRRERPRRRRAASERDELAALNARTHSITSSARASTVGGISRPSAFAVLRLITNSNLVGSWTGRSPGFSPFSMRAA